MAKEQEKMFQGAGYVLYLDCGGGGDSTTVYNYQNASGSTCKMGEFY